MVAYNFQERFADDVAAGVKRQTIRAHSLRRHARPGDELQLYTGMRTKKCRLIRRARCEAVMNCVIAEDHAVLGFDRVSDLDSFASLDGFPSYREMTKWFRDAHGLPFRGLLIRW